ncbi:MAG: hypothetical protein PHQ59_02550 [Candidatus Daviesbacteria bacterium]|nr:hypothetical protein [Candidatus Daviesbacteria bacterium]
MVNLKKYLSNHLWILIVPLSFFAIRALLVPGFYGASDDLHIAWLFELDRLVKLGQFPPRFVPDLSYSFGYPLFNFVFPLPFYLAEVFHLIGFSLVDSIKAVFLLSVPLSGVLMYQFLKTFTSKSLSLAGAIMYMYSPYRSTDIYIRGAIGEIVAFIFLPLAALSITNLFARSNDSKQFINLRWIGIGAFAFAGLVLTHNIAAYMFMPLLFILAVAKLISIKNYLRNLLNLFAAFFLGLMISLYFWLPAIQDSSLMKYDTVFNFVDHFPTIKQLIVPYWGYGASVAGPNDGMSFFLGMPTLFIIVIGIFLIGLAWKRFSGDQKVVVGWAIASLLIALIMMNFRSILIWQKVPLIPFFQFPWRFLIITTFAAPILVIAFDKLRYRNFVALVILILVLITNFSSFHPQDYLGRGDSYYLNKYIPLSIASEEYSKTQEEYLRLPLGTVQRPDKIYPRVFPQTGQIIQVKELDSLTALIDTNSNEKFTLNYNKYYFPGWYATIDNQDADISAGAPFGQIQVAVPSGSHVIKIGFAETKQKIFLDIISVVGIIIAVLCCINPDMIKKWKTT